jgi:hypothetical protein
MDEIQLSLYAAIALMVVPILFALWVWRQPSGALLISGLLIMLATGAVVWRAPMIALAGPAVLFVGGATLVAVGAGLHALATRLDSLPNKIADAIVRKTHRP